MHNWEPWFMDANLKGRKLKIYGHKGKQVRDIIDARDLVQAFHAFAQNPRPGEVYNMGGGRENSMSLLEALELIESITSKKTQIEFGPEREGDHIVYISNLGKFKSHYPEWKIERSTNQIFNDLYKKIERNQ